MKIILLQNTIISGDRYVAGEFADVADALAKKFEEAGLAYIAPESVDAPVNVSEELPEEVNEQIEEEELPEEEQGIEQAFDPIFDTVVEEEEEKPEPVKTVKRAPRSKKPVAK